VGFGLAIAGFLVLTAGSVMGGAGKAPLIPEVLFFVCVDFAIPWIDTVVLTMVSRDSPPGLTSTMLGFYYVSAAAGNFFTGWLGGFSDRMSMPSFWLTHAAIAGGCLVFLVLAGGWLGRFLRRPVGGAGEGAATA
jgi:POT family proton-dependent oligopeptide transporter